MENLSRFNHFSELAAFDPFSDGFCKSFSLHPDFRHPAGGATVQLSDVRRLTVS